MVSLLPLFSASPAVAAPVTTSARMQPVAITPAIASLIRQHAVVAIGVSGGKDSQAAAMAVFEYLDRAHHSGPRLLIHADLGSVEWADSLPTCQKLAERLSVELVTVRRNQGGLMERWESRWRSNVLRYENLGTVTLVPCWSTPAMRFCTSELKSSKIHAELKRRFAPLPIINVTGVRREESRRRAHASVADQNAANGIWTWRPIVDWSQADVFSAIDAWRLDLHPAYRQFGLTRVSCRFCIMSSLADLKAATGQPETHDLYRRMVDLECRSTFAFQGGRWLGDIAPQLLTAELRNKLAFAKDMARQRMELEKRITKPMLYLKGWPTRLLSAAEADILADVRTKMNGLLDLNADHLDRASILQRYAELLALRSRKEKAA
ncbi:phosphoadenosine phosphosulfate reductase family protein [Ochrobactrum sp. XJ1]|nr:phosphoadenosine phosphosulfate reductase family protein [Ochrobactrum sp. XJ1]